MTPQEFASKIREKYPGAYDSIGDEELSNRVIAKYPVYTSQVNFAQPEPQEQGFFGGVKESLETRTDRFAEITGREDTGLITKGTQVFGQGAGLAADVFEGAVEQVPGVKPAFEALGSGIQWLATTKFSPLKLLGDQIGKSKLLQEATTLYDEDPNFKDTVDAVANIARLGGDVQLASDAVGFSKNVVKKLQARTPEITSKIAGDISSATSKITEKAIPLGEKAGALKERVGTNIETYKASQQAIQKLPTQTQRTAVRQGIEITDVTEISKFFDDPITSQTSKTLYKELADTAKSFSEAGGRGVDPISVVGKPIVERVSLLNKQLGKIGQKLGEVSNNLGNVTRSELLEAVTKRLQGVSGLNGLKVGKNGILNFKNTTLASSLSKADQKAIQQIFGEAIKAGTGKSKHLLRQELFEILGGKKSSQVTMTATQDKAFQAVRQALSDVLESKNSLYKSLSNEYRKVINPLGKMRKLLKSVKGEAGENIDLFELEAGMLARRLTSTSISRAQVEALLRELDAVGIELGGSAISTRNLQEFYNILNKYYELSPKTGYQGQIKGAIEPGGGGVIDRIAKAVTGTVGQTPAVRQSALEKLISELLAEK